MNRELQQREKWLLVILGVSLVVSAYMLIRIRPVRIQLAELSMQLQKAQKKYQKEKSAVARLGSVPAMRNEVERLQQQIETETKTMDGYKQAFIDLQHAGQQADLKAAIGRLIEQQGLIIVDTGEADQSLDKLVAGNSSGAQEIKRPMIKLTLSGNFSQLHQFIQQLEQLQNSVVVTSLSLQTERQEDMRQPYRLRAKLILAL